MKTEAWATSASFVIVALACVGLLGREAAKADRPANEAAKCVHDEAVRILESIKHTEYRHKTDIDEAKGAYYCDCSGFLGYVLNRTVAKADGKGPFGDGKMRPLAMNYEQAFAAAPAKAPSPYSLPNGEGFIRWQKIARLVDARPGDVIAWRREVPKPGNTGHVVIVDQAPVVEEDGLVRLRIIDSTTLPSSDITGEKGKTGIGRRTMWFKVDEDGKPVAHIRGSRSAKPKVEPISIGRALPMVEKPASRRAA
jgi:hypothetical protein